MSAHIARRQAGLERVGLFVDGANLYYATRALGFEVDFAAMLRFFGGSTYLVRACYYTALIETEDYSPLRPLTDWLAYNGWRVVTKPAKEQADPTGRRRIKGNMDIELAVDMMELAPHLDHAVLVSGDGDFRRVVEAVQRQGVKVTVVSTMESQPPMIADELRRQADGFLELADIGPEIARRAPAEARPRPAASPPANGPRPSRVTPADPYGEAPDIEPE
ncbi:MAG: NYN domain-containing protein [Roseomonas sp.]|nr:NYN domain-containing protein [Roseomonas sp.]MCA3326625.1 NYN domain-containing protein [Roseomonas sp.]MCA3329480.1 NYN domain-containing protein [Roseomonas sp.]MCA3335770.1 NYN domain-containing protein [Roseomonas sp.]MCA3345260.1 NYN domain-containing protein [Roseomonas sp.]